MISTRTSAVQTMQYLTLDYPLRLLQELGVSVEILFCMWTYQSSYLPGTRCSTYMYRAIGPTYLTTNTAFAQIYHTVNPGANCRQRWLWLNISSARYSLSLSFFHFEILNLAPYNSSSAQTWIANSRLIPTPTTSPSI